MAMSVVSIDFDFTDDFNRAVGGIDSGTLTFDLDLDSTVDERIDDGFPFFFFGDTITGFDFEYSVNGSFENGISYSTVLQPGDSFSQGGIFTDGILFSYRDACCSTPLLSFSIGTRLEEPIYTRDEIQAATTYDDLFDESLLVDLLNTDTSFVFFDREQVAQITNVSFNGVDIGVSEVPLGGSVGYMVVALAAVAAFKKFMRRT